MKKINEKIFKIFKWNIGELLKDLIGVTIFCFGINMFVEPIHIYSGGILGLAQLLNRLINSIWSYDIYLTGTIYLLINIPLLILAYSKVSSSFCAKTIFTVAVQTILLDVIPIPAKPLVNDILTNVLIGGTLVGIGVAHVLSSTGSTGGTDIIAIIVTSKHSKFSVGRFSLFFNGILFGISGLLYGISTMIYSIMYSVVENISIDKLHDQNVSTFATLYTKKYPKEILEFVEKDLNRGATWWEATGEYENTKTYVTNIALSRYELHKLEKYINITNQDVFLVKNEGVGVKGNFSKRL